MLFLKSSVRRWRWTGCLDCAAWRNRSSPFDPIPFDAEAARIHGRVCGAVISAGRRPRRRIADLMIASIAIAESLPLFTTNPEGFKGLDDLLTVVPTGPGPGPGCGRGAPADTAAFCGP